MAPRYTRPRGGVKLVSFDPVTGEIKAWLDIADNSFRFSDHPPGLNLRAGGNPSDDITDLEWLDSRASAGVDNWDVNITKRKLRKP